MIDPEAKKKYDEVAEAVNAILLGSAPGSKFGPSPGLLGVAPIFGAVKSGQLVGPKRLQEWFNQFGRMSVREAEQHKIGSGVFGDVFRIPDTDITMKIPSSRNRDVISEAMRLHRLKDDPTTSVKQFIGTLSKPTRDLKSPGPYSEMMDHIATGKVKIGDVEKDPILFTRLMPGGKSYPDQSGIMNIDEVRAALDAISKRGVNLRDLHPGNVFVNEGKPIFVDLGLGRDLYGREEMLRPNLYKDYAKRPAYHEMFNVLLKEQARGGDKPNEALKKMMVAKLSGSTDPKVIDKWLKNFRNMRGGAIDAEFEPVINIPESPGGPAFDILKKATPDSIKKFNPADPFHVFFNEMFPEFGGEANPIRHGGKDKGEWAKAFKAWEDLGFTKRWERRVLGPPAPLGPPRPNTAERRGMERAQNPDDLSRQSPKGFVEIMNEVFERLKQQRGR